jgi:DNA modification methylase
MNGSVETLTLSEKATLFKGDCLAVLPSLPAGCVESVVTDPPYGQSNETYDRGADAAVWRECYRVAAPDAALLSFAGSPTYHRLASDIEAAGWKVRQMWAWVYRDGLITSAYPREGFDRLAPAMTPICFATKGKVLLNLVREGGPWEVRFDRRTLSRFSARVGAGGRKAGAGHWPRSVVCTEGVDGFQYFVLSHNASTRGRAGHPNEKPVPLMEWLVGKLPGGTVLDPFMGSASTGVACLNLGRRFLGVELDARYFDVARERLAREGA